MMILAIMTIGGINALNRLNRGGSRVFTISKIGGITCAMASATRVKSSPTVANCGPMFVNNSTIIVPTLSMSVDIGGKIAFTRIMKAVISDSISEDTTGIAAPRTPLRVFARVLIIRIRGSTNVPKLFRIMPNGETTDDSCMKTGSNLSIAG